MAARVDAAADAEITAQVQTELLWIARRYAGAAHGKRSRQPAVRLMRERWALQAARFEQLAAAAQRIFAEADRLAALAANAAADTDAEMEGPHVRA